MNYYDFKPSVLPTKLFKYRPVDDYDSSWIVDCETYFPSAADFNDPFDCKVNTSLTADFKEVQAYIASRADWVHAGAPLAERIFQSGESAKMHLRGDSAEALSQVQKPFHQVGVLSLSAKGDDILMFAHYCRSHTGVCLEYTTRNDAEFFGGAKQVEYSEDFSTIPFYTARPLELATRTLIRKAKAWAYEEEWRVFRGTKRTKVQTSKTALTGIIFGCRMDEGVRQRLIGLNSKREHPATLFQAIPNSSRYQLDIVRV